MHFSHILNEIIVRYAFMLVLVLIAIGTLIFFTSYRKIADYYTRIGYEKGMHRRSELIAKNLLSEELSIEKISIVTGLSHDEIKYLD